MSSNPHNLLISQSTTPLYIKFALFCLHKTSMPRWFGYFCFVLSHLQTLAVLIKSAYLAFPDNTPSSSPMIKLFLKLFILGDWLSEENIAPLLVGTVIITIYTIKVIGMMAYICYYLALKREIPSLIQRYWSTLHSMHPLLIFFWIHTFCAGVRSYSKHDDGIHLFMTVMSYFNTTVNCTFAVFFSIISVIYKTKELISSKTNVLQIKDIIFKILIPILWLAAENNQGVQILVLILALVNAILHDWIMIKYLPYYRINVLVLSAVLQALQTSLALVTCILKLLTKDGINKGVFSVEVMWLFMVPVFGKAYYLFTWKKIMHAFQCELKDEKNVYYLVHKRFVLLYFLKSRNIIHEAVKKLGEADLMYQAKLTRVTASSGSPFDELDKDRKFLKRNLRFICQNILDKNPKALLAQISLAFSYSKFDDLYLASNNLLEDALSKNPGYHAQISLNMIRLELQRKLLTMQQGSGEGLDVSGYLVNQELHQKVKDNMRKQADMQLEFWKQFVQNKPDMLSLMNIAQKINNQKKNIKVLWSSLLEVRSTSFLSPLRMYGMYCCMINNDNIEGEKYLEQSQEDAKRMKRFLKMDELNNQTIFSEKTVKITMSGLRSKLGKILECSPNITSLYGWQSHYMKDRPIGCLMPLFYRQRHDKFLMDHYNTGKINVLNKTQLSPVKSSDGYIRPTWMHIKVSPLMDQGISYLALLRPCTSSQRMILVRGNGIIDAMSAEFAKEMNLVSQTEEDIYGLCPDFKKINEAFNLIVSQSIGKVKSSEKEASSPMILQRRSEEMTEKYKSFDDDDVQAIYNAFTRTGSTLTFYPKVKTNIFIGERGSLVYNVKITNKIHDGDIIKYVMLTPENDLREIQSSSDHGQDSPSPQFAKQAPRSSDETNLSIFDELQNHDSNARRIISRSIVKETLPSVEQITQITIQQKFSFQTGEEMKPMGTKSQLLRRKTKRSTMQYQREEYLKAKKVEDVEKAESVGASYQSKGRKAEQQVAQTLKMEPKKRSEIIYSYTFLVVILAMIVLMIVQKVTLSSGIQEIEGQIPVITTAFLRQVNMVSSVLMIRGWSGVIEGGVTSGDWNADNLMWRMMAQPYIKDLNRYHKEFYQQLRGLSAEAQSRFYEKNAGIYISNGDDDGETGGTFFGFVSTAQAYQMILEKEQSILNIELPSSFIPNIDISDFKFVLNNTLNDLYLQSHNQIYQMVDDMEDSMSSTVLNMGFTVGAVFVICVIFLVVLIRYLYQVGKEAKIFMVMIFRLKPHDCEAIQTTIERFKNGLNTDTKSLDMIDKEETVRNNAELNKFRSASMNSLYKKQRVAFLKLLPNFVLFVIWSCVYFLLTSNLIEDIKFSEKQMETALEMLNSQSLLAAEFVGVALTNSTAIIKNAPIMPDFLVNLNRLQETSLLIDNLRNENEELTAFQESVLFNFPCENFLTLYNGNFAKAYASCLVVGKEKGSIGLVSVNSQFYAAMVSLMEMLGTGLGTPEELSSLFASAISQYLDLFYNAEGLLNILYMTTHDDFNKKVDVVKNTVVILTLVVFTVTLVGPLVAWYMIMKKIFRLQKIDWEILQILPIRLILGNKYLQQYLLKHSRGMLNSGGGGVLL